MAKNILAICLMFLVASSVIYEAQGTFLLRRYIRKRFFPRRCVDFTPYAFKGMMMLAGNLEGGCPATREFREFFLKFKAYLSFINSVSVSSSANIDFEMTTKCDGLAKAMSLLTGSRGEQSASSDFRMTMLSMGKTLIEQKRRGSMMMTLAQKKELGLAMVKWTRMIVTFVKTAAEKSGKSIDISSYGLDVDVNASVGGSTESDSSSTNTGSQNSDSSSTESDSSSSGSATYKDTTTRGSGSPSGSPTGSPSGETTATGETSVKGNANGSGSGSGSGSENASGSGSGSYKSKQSASGSFSKSGSENSYSDTTGAPTGSPSGSPTGSPSGSTSASGETFVKGSTSGSGSASGRGNASSKTNTESKGATTGSPSGSPTGSPSDSTSPSGETTVKGSASGSESASGSGNASSKTKTESKGATSSESSSSNTSVKQVESETSKEVMSFISGLEQKYAGKAELKVFFDKLKISMSASTKVSTTDAKDFVSGMMAAAGKLSEAMVFVRSKFSKTEEMKSSMETCQQQVMNTLKELQNINSQIVSQSQGKTVTSTQQTELKQTITKWEQVTTQFVETAASSTSSSSSFSSQGSMNAQAN